MGTINMKVLFSLLFLISSSYTISEPKPSNELSCSLCKTVMELLDAYLTDTTSEQAVVLRRNRAVYCISIPLIQVADALKQICSLLPSPLDQECEVMITEYTDDIIELIVNQYMDPSEVCEAIGLCP